MIVKLRKLSPGPGIELQVIGRKKGSVFYRAVIGLLVCLLTLGNFSVRPSPVKAGETKAPQEVYLSFDPSELKVKVGEEFWVGLKIEEVLRLFGVGVQVKYEPGMLEFLPATQEQPLERGEVFGPNYYPAKNNIDSQNGILEFEALVEFPPGNGFSGTGTLFKMKFKALQAGEATLSIITEGQKFVLEPIDEEKDGKITAKLKNDGVMKITVEESTPAVGPVSGDGSPAAGSPAPAGGSPAAGSPAPGGGTPQGGDNTGEESAGGRDQSPAPQPGKDENGKKSETGGKTGGPTGGPSDQVSFRDLPANHWAFQEVNALVKKGFVKGYEDGTFKPQQNVSRQEFAVLIARITGLEGKTIPGYTLTYKDADQVAGWACQSVTAATYLGIFRGDAQGRFNPADPVSRAEITAVLIRLLDKEKEAAQLQPGDVLFTDIENHWAKGCIALAKKLQLVGGYAEGSFKPQGQTSRAEVSVMLVRLLKYRHLV